MAKRVTALHDDFRGDGRQPFLDAWRQYLYGRCIALLDEARESRDGRAPPAECAELQRPPPSHREGPARERAMFAARCSRSIGWLFVDEFQDTDPVQAEIMFLLAARTRTPPIRSAAGSQPSADPPTGARAASPGALFVVGDPKQSIYRFRRADIDIYNEVRERLGGAKRRGRRLTTNFRSVPGLCTWANDVFADAFPATPTKQAPAFAPLHAEYAPRPAKGIPSGIFTLTAPESHRFTRCRGVAKPTTSRATSAARSTPAAASTAIF